MIAGDRKTALRPGEDAPVEILWTADYEAYGRPLLNHAICPGKWENPIGFTGYYYDGDLFEHYYGQARYYDPYTGRFLSQDPADFEYDNSPISINRYLYCGNNPLHFVDPDGRFILAAIFGLALEAVLADMACFAVVGGRGESS